MELLPLVSGRTAQPKAPRLRPADQGLSASKHFRKGDLTIEQRPRDQERALRVAIGAADISSDMFMRGRRRDPEENTDFRSPFPRATRNERVALAFGQLGQRVQTLGNSRRVRMMRRAASNA